MRSIDVCRSPLASLRARRRTRRHGMEEKGGCSAASPKGERGTSSESPEVISNPRGHLESHFQISVWSQSPTLEDFWKQRYAIGPKKFSKARCARLTVDNRPLQTLYRLSQVCPRMPRVWKIFRRVFQRDPLCVSVSPNVKGHFQISVRSQSLSLEDFWKRVMISEVPKKFRRLAALA